MPAEKLVEIKPKAGLDLGLYPSVEPTNGAIWRDGENVWFRELTLENVPGRVKAIQQSSRQSRALAQTFTISGRRRLYFEDRGIVRFWEEQPPLIVGTLNPAGTSYDFETWGDWLLATDGVSPLKIWKNIGIAFTTAGDSQTQFQTVKIIKRLGQHVLAYCTDVLPQGFHWSSANNPELWTPDQANSARNLPIRNLDSEIICVAELGARHAVYSKNYMLLVQFVGPTQWFATPAQALQGIGAVSKDSVVTVGNYNVGLSRNGVFMTDGNSFSYVDRPAIDKWVQDNVEWSRANEVVGYWDERLGMVVWSVPMASGGKAALTLDPKAGRADAPRIFSRMAGDFSSALRRESFDYPVVSTPTGIFYASVPNTLLGSFNLSTHLFDGGNQTELKSWDMLYFQGHVGIDTWIRVGFAQTPSLNAIEWQEWQPIEHIRVPFGPRESVYMAFEIKGTEFLRCNGITIYGEKAGML